jgi:hypothetical protein
MSGHFNAKSLTFYAVAIAFVVTLFSIVTAYGEKNLKAPPAISGLYPIAADALPECLGSQPLVLHVQQSGIYVNAALKPATGAESAAASSEEKHPLSGRFTNQQVSLAGPVATLPKCQSSDSATSATIQGQFANKTLTGEIQLSSLPQAIAFTAKQEAPKPTSSAH